MAEPRYQASVQDVQDHLPHLTFSDQLPPTFLQAEALLVKGGDWVATRLGVVLTAEVIPDPARLAGALGHARTATALRAAAFIEAADRPEALQYAEWLLAQADAAVDEVLGAVGGEDGTAGGEGGYLGGGLPRASFPDPLFTADWQV